MIKPYPVKAARGRQPERPWWLHGVAVLLGGAILATILLGFGVLGS